MKKKTLKINKTFNEILIKANIHCHFNFDKTRLNFIFNNLVDATTMRHRKTTSTTQPIGRTSN